MSLFRSCNLTVLKCISVGIDGFYYVHFCTIRTRMIDFVYAGCCLFGCVTRLLSTEGMKHEVMTTT